jgi:DNA repair protein RecO (recombination protein O)
MTHNADLQPAFVLHQQKYRETSLILDVLTRDFGRVPLIAKGVRKPKSKTAALLQPFVPITITYHSKTELGTLTHVEPSSPPSPLRGLAIYCGFYINELLGHFLHTYDPNPDVFWAYQTCLQGLADHHQLQTALRIFELELLNHCGYGLDFTQTADTFEPIDPEKKYHFKKGLGLVASANGPLSGTTLHALAAYDFASPQIQTEAKWLMRTVIDSHLQGKPLKSRAVIQQIISSGIYG